MITKLKHLCALIIFLTCFEAGNGQVYVVKYQAEDIDSISLFQQIPLQTRFNSLNEAGLYIIQLPGLFQANGFITASIDSVRYDSTSAHVALYLGKKYQWTSIRTRPGDEGLLQAIQWPRRSFSGPVDFVLLKTWQQRILDHLEDNGHPFGKVFLDSIGLDEGQVSGVLHIDQGPVYKIDSIRLHGDAKVSNEFLQRYLDIPNGSIYNRTKLQSISKKLAAISYIEEERPSDLSLLGTGSVLNLYLKARKSSQVNALIGFLPNSEQLQGTKKLLITADVNVLLRNAFGNGETMGLVWQQLQQRSPRLNLVFDQPYFLRSRFGLNFMLEMYKRDSVFLNINMNLGTGYRLDENRSASIFLQRRQTIVSGINSASIIQSRTLPREMDVSSLNLGIGYNYNNTDYRFNPRKGNELILSGSAGTKKVRKNNLILELKDPFDPSFNFERLYDTVKMKAYQFRVTAGGAHYFPLGGQSTIRTGVSAGIYQSASYFRNELFQIGGFKLLRGFDEESQFVSQYAIATVEYRYRVSLNSFFFVFADGGWGKHQLEAINSHTYFGTGIGLSLETKAGIINMAWAIGKRDDTEINLRQSKFHLGFASFF